MDLGPSEARYTFHHLTLHLVSQLQSMQAKRPHAIWQIALESLAPLLCFNQFFQVAAGSLTASLIQPPFLCQPCPSRYRCH